MGKIIAVFYALSIYTSIAGFSQSQISPPHLKTRYVPGIALYAGFRQLQDSATVITIKFKISETGFLDTLQVSPNAPSTYFDTIQKQLSGMNGKWNPEQNDGKPQKSKWLIYRHYVMGPASRGARIWHEVKEAYKRDYDLFRCQHNPKRRIQCLTPYIEGPDFFLFPPEWYGTYE
jgi:hypothetical protein